MEQKQTKLYRIWISMRQRCRDSKHKNYKNYGARGIKVATEWEDFFVFAKWAHKNGYVEHLQIDRINTDGNYEPSNCRWVTSKVNNNNRRDCVYLQVDGNMLSAKAACEMYNVDYEKMRTWTRTRNMTYQEAFDVMRSLKDD